MSQEKQPSSTSDPESMKPFFLMWTGQALSLLGSQIAQFALIWWLTLDTGSATVLATATFLGFVPMMAVGPLAGALIDRWNRRRILLVADTVSAVVSIGLAFFFWQGVATPSHIFLALFVRALAAGFHQPTMMAVTSQMVKKDLLTQIQGLNESLDGLLLIVAAPLGGLLLGWMPMAGILGIDVVTAAFAILPLLFIQVPQPREDEPKEKASVWEDIVEGFRFVRGWPGLMILVLLSTTINLFVVPAASLLPLLISNHFSKGPLELGWASATLGIGMVAGGVLLGVWGGFRRRIVTALIGLLGLSAAVSVIGLASAGQFSIALGAMFVVGFMVALANGPIQAMLQTTVAPEFQGRVFTLLQTLSTAATPIGLILAAPIADTFGVRAWFLAGGVVCAAMATFGFTIPALMRIEERSPDTEVTSTPEEPNDTRQAA